MKEPRIKNVQFDVSFLNQLVEDEHSCVEMQRLTQHIALHPYHLTDLTNSIKEVLNKGVAQYSALLDGILFGYSNIKLLTELGAVFDDSCFIHVDVEADFFIFKPVVGNILTGIVNKKSEDHIGCLVHKLFNVSAPKREHKEKWLGKSIQLGSEVSIKITHTNFEGRLPYIRGEITAVLFEPAKLETSQNSKITFDDAEPEEEEQTALLDETPKSKKKKSKKTDLSIKMEAESPAPSKKDKKHKKKIKEEQLSQEELILDEVLKAELDSEKSSKKRKRSHSEVEYSEERKIKRDSEEVSPKKKRKRTE